MTIRIKNYTSSVPAGQTIYTIEQLLIEAGASAIQKEYHEGKTRAICFLMPMEWGQSGMVRLPADIEAIARLLKLAKPTKRKMTPDQEEKIQKQAERTAWKLVEDWLRVQLTLVQTKQIKMGQIFMAYLWDGKRTLYQLYSEGRLKELPPASPERKAE